MNIKLSVKPAILKYLVLGAGAAGFALRSLLYAVALDESGLLTRNHPLGAAVWVLSAAVLVGTVLLTRKIEGPESQSDSFQASPIAGAGCLAAAAVIVFSAFAPGLHAWDTVELLVRVLAIASAAALAVIGFSRLTGAKPYFLLYAAVCLYFALRMVSQYRIWSADPQLQDYCFQLLACVCLTLTAYHHGAFGAEMGSHRNLWLCSLLSVYLCCLSLAGPQNRLFCLGCGVWAFTNLSNLSAKTRRQRPRLNLQEEAGSQEV